VVKKVKEKGQTSFERGRREARGRCGRSFTTDGSMEALVCQIIYYVVLDSNGFATVSGRKEGSSAQMWEVNSRQLKVEGKRLGLVILLARTNAHRFKSLSTAWRRKTRAKKDFSCSGFGMM
jgi:hypothetical protein